MPARYEPTALLGKGGGGEVWAVRDRVTRRDFALKVLAEDAGDAEVMAVGRLPNSTGRFLVRELVEGRSLEEVIKTPPERAGGASQHDELARHWLPPLASAADQLTVIHRAGLLHGDIKPANVIVGK